jgi:hypothetical protein
MTMDARIADEMKIMRGCGGENDDAFCVSNI